MNRKFIETQMFRKTWAAMEMTERDLYDLQEIILSNPQAGDVIQGTGGARKLRIQMEGRGKRGGGRVIYVDIYEMESIYLLMAYPKNVQENLTPEQTKAVRDLVNQIKGE